MDARSTVFGYILLHMNSDMPEKMLLSQSKAALKGWSSRFPLHSRTGVDLQVWDVVAWQCLENDDPLAAAAIMIQGDSYLRPTEVLQLQASHVLKPIKSRANCWGFIVGHRDEGIPTKAGLYDDCVLLNTPSRSDLGVVMKYLMSHCKRPSAKLFRGLTLRDYNSSIKEACEKLGLQHLKLTPHVLRHSGPSSDICHKVRSLKAIQQRGRWASPKSVARYQKPGRMLMLHQLVPQHIWDRTKSCRRDAIKFFQQHVHKNA